MNTRRYRQVFFASLATVLVSATLLGLIGVTHWRGQQVLKTDTRTVIAQATEQLRRSLRSRRGTLTFFRDTLNRRPDLTPEHLQAMAASATQHTRHLLGVGLVQSNNRLTWWHGPASVGAVDLPRLHHATIQRTRLRGVWRVPSTFVSEQTSRPYLLMLEPLRAAHPGRGAVVGVFDLKPLLADFFASGVHQHYPVQLLDGDTLLFRSGNWRPSDDRHPMVVVEHLLSIDAARWTVQMEPSHSGIVQTLSWFNLLLITLSVIAGGGVTAIVWLLAMRTWILQRAVARRTAALRRTLQRLRQLATTDELTGLYNRRFFLNRWQWEYQRARRYQRPLACLMIDVNGFKQVNDRLGHHAGDLVLQHVAKELQTMLRQSDILARFGGDEFMIALPETTPAHAQHVAQKLRDLQVTVRRQRAQSIPPVRISVGIACLVGDARPEEILQAADESLYTSRKQTAQTAAPLPVEIEAS